MNTWGNSKGTSQGVLVLGVAAERPALPRLLQLSMTSTLHTSMPFCSTRREALWPTSPFNKDCPPHPSFQIHLQIQVLVRANLAVAHLWALQLAKSLVSSQCCPCSASFNGGQTSSLQSWCTHESPCQMEFHDESSNVSSLGCSATAHISWRPNLLLWSKWNLLTAFAN